LLKGCFSGFLWNNGNSLRIYFSVWKCSKMFFNNQNISSVYPTYGSYQIISWILSWVECYFSICQNGFPRSSYCFVNRMIQLVFLLKKSHNFFIFIKKERKFIGNFIFLVWIRRVLLIFGENNHELFDIAIGKKKKKQKKKQTLG
jgi:hypothetical protein